MGDAARIQRLEEESVFLNATLDDLSEVVFAQQQQIDLLLLELEKLKSAMAAASLGGESNQPDPPPPHY